MKSKETILADKLEFALGALGGDDANPEWVSEIMGLVHRMRDAASAPGVESGKPTAGELARQKASGLRTRGNIRLRVDETADAEAEADPKAKGARVTTEQYERAAVESL